MTLCSACGDHPAVANGTDGYDGKHPWDGPVCYVCSYLPGGAESEFRAVWSAQVRSIAATLAAPKSAGESA